SSQSSGGADRFVLRKAACSLAVLAKFGRRCSALPGGQPRLGETLPAAQEGLTRRSGGQIHATEEHCSTELLCSARHRRSTARWAAARGPGPGGGAGSERRRLRETNLYNASASVRSAWENGTVASSREATSCPSLGSGREFCKIDIIQMGYTAGLYMP
ncbi:unnamed protein product, partial [Urochloa humidicola]